MNRLMRLAVGAGCALAAHSACAADLSINEEDKIAAFAAAGFMQVNGEYWRCEDTVTISRQAGRLELVDLNEDGLPEAFVKESSTFCYGNTAEAFVLVTKDADGGWRPLLDQVGIPVVSEGIWPDIEVGGPGFGPFPIFRFNGTVYEETP